MGTDTDSSTPADVHHLRVVPKWMEQEKEGRSCGKVGKHTVALFATSRLFLILSSFFAAAEDSRDET